MSETLSSQPNMSDRPDVTDDGQIAHHSGETIAHDGSVERSRVAHVIGVAIALVVGTIVFGFFSLLDAVKDVDAAVYRASLSVLQAVPGSIRVSELVTQIGSIPVNYGMAMGGALAVWVQRRRIAVPILIVVTLLATHALQKLAIGIVDGVIPVDDRIVGAAGPYYSGGVARVVVLAGIIASAVLARSAKSDRLVWQLAIGFGLIEAITRLALGRHWPIDLVASFPIALTTVWLFRRVQEWIEASQPSSSVPAPLTVSSAQQRYDAPEHRAQNPRRDAQHQR